MKKGRQRRRTDRRLEAASDKGFIDGCRHLDGELRAQAPFGMVDDELDHSRRWNRDCNLASISQPEPGGPIPKRGLVATRGVCGFAFLQQVLHRLQGDRRERRWVGQSGVRER